MAIDKPTTPPPDLRDTVPETPDAKRPDAAAPVEAKAAPESGPRPELAPLIGVFEDPDTSPEAALNILESYDPKAMDDDFREDLAIIAGDYGLALDELPPEEQRKLGAFWFAVKKGRTGEARQATADAFEARIGTLLFDRAMAKVEGLSRELRTKPAESYEELEGKLRDVMRAITEAAKNTPVDEEHEYEWRDIDLRYSQLMDMKLASGPEVRQVFEQVLDRYSDFIEYDLLAFRLSKDRGDVQTIMRDVYGRTPEEMEAIKRENRVATAELIKDLAGKPALEIADLEELHKVNNKGIVPKKFGNIRSGKGDLPPTFVQRIGLMSEDLRPALQDVLDSANRLRAGGVGEGEGQYTKQEYALVAAQLHNAVLDMHPWGDRNGSTSLLFLETLMTKAGYEPPAEREKDFHKNVGNILGWNETALAIVAEELMRQQEPGFYDSRFTESPQKVKDYRRIINLVRAAARRPRVEWPDETPDED